MCRQAGGTPTSGKTGRGNSYFYVDRKEELLRLGRQERGTPNSGKTGKRNFYAWEGRKEELLQL